MLELCLLGMLLQAETEVAPDPLVGRQVICRQVMQRDKYPLPKTPGLLLKIMFCIPGFT